MWICTGSAALITSIPTSFLNFTRYNSKMYPHVQLTQKTGFTNSGSCQDLAILDFSDQPGIITYLRRAAQIDAGRWSC